MSDKQQLLEDLTRNYNVLLAQLDGLSHEDSLLQVPFRGNCLNWVMGHIITYRATMLEIAGVELFDGAEAYKRYGHGSEPITDGSDAIGLETMLADLAISQRRLAFGLPEMTETELNHQPEGDERTIGQRLAFLCWHESYHTGQTEYLRQLAGTDDKII